MMNKKELAFKLDVLIKCCEDNKSLDFDYEITSHRKGIGAVIVFCKKIARRVFKTLFFWLYEPVFKRQNTMNQIMYEIAVLMKELAEEEE